MRIPLGINILRQRAGRNPQGASVPICNIHEDTLLYQRVAYPRIPHGINIDDKWFAECEDTFRYQHITASTGRDP